MGLKQDIVIVNEFSVPSPSGKGGSRGGTPGAYVTRYMARENAVEHLTPIRLHRTDDFILRYMARESAVERAPSAYDAKLAMRKAQGRGGVAFGYGQVSLSHDQLVSASKDVQQLFEQGHTVLKTVLSFDEEYLRRHGLIPQDFRCERPGDYRGHLDQMKLRMAIMHGLDRMSHGHSGFDDLCQIPRPASLSAIPHSIQMVMRRSLSFCPRFVPGQQWVIAEATLLECLLGASGVRCEPSHIGVVGWKDFVCDESSVPVQTPVRDLMIGEGQPTMQWNAFYGEGSLGSVHQFGEAAGHRAQGGVSLDFPFTVGSVHAAVSECRAKPYQGTDVVVGVAQHEEAGTGDVALNVIVVQECSCFCCTGLVDAQRASPDSLCGFGG